MVTQLWNIFHQTMPPIINVMSLTTTEIASNPISFLKYLPSDIKSAYICKTMKGRERGRVLEKERGRESQGRHKVLAIQKTKS